MKRSNIYHSIALTILMCTSITLSAQMHNDLFKVQEGYLSRHDIVYLDPDYQGFNGFPLGNGDLGGMLWLNERGIEMQVNKIDLYDCPEKGLMTLRAAGRIKIDFGIPCFDYLYLKDFEGRLSLWNAMTNIHSNTPFSNVHVRSWVNADNNVWVIDCETEGSSSSPLVSINRWGSRDFGGWYGGYNTDIANGLGKAHSLMKGKDMLVEESLEGGLSFSIACRVIASEVTPQIVSEKEYAIRLPQRKKHHFKILISVVSSNESSDPTATATALLNKATAKGTEQLLQNHINWWHAFWNRSFVHLGDDYLENIYYMRRYLMGSSSRGRYLSPFNGGLWVWNRDIRQWTTPHHWNTQESYWGLAEENDCDLIRPYIDTYFRLMPQAEAYAATRGIKNAILWTEAHDFSGRMVSADWGNMVNNFTPASQIASIFWEYYQYTEDYKCLRDTIYPFMKKAAEFYLQYLKWDKTKKQYYIFPSQPYEHEFNNGLKNCITDRYMIESLFDHCIEAANILNADKKKVKAWQHVKLHLWEPPIVNVTGIGEMFGMAYRPDGMPYPSAQEYPKFQMYHFDAHTTAVFPAGVLGLNEKGSHYFDIAQRIALRHPQNRNAITPGAIVSARLGLAEKVKERLSCMVSYLQHFNQGLFYNLDHWSNLSRYASRIDSATLYTQRDYIFDNRTLYNKNGTGNSGLWATPFVQCGMETLGIFGTAVNEMLMQSHEGKIRVFPATPEDWESSFTLLARNGFLVSATKEKQGYIRGVDIQSLSGKICHIQNPWGQQKIFVTSEGHPVNYRQNTEGVISFPTIKGRTYILRVFSTLDLSPIIYTKSINKRPKHFSEATLGKERTFTRQ